MASYSAASLEKDREIRRCPRRRKGISRQTFHNLKDRVAKRGRAGILPDDTAPRNPARLRCPRWTKIAGVGLRSDLDLPPLVRHRRPGSHAVTTNDCSMAE